MLDIAIRWKAELIMAALALPPREGLITICARISPSSSLWCHLLQELQQSVESCRLKAIFRFKHLVKHKDL